MARKTYTAEQIIRKLREARVEVARGDGVVHGIRAQPSANSGPNAARDRVRWII